MASTSGASGDGSLKDRIFAIISESSNKSISEEEINMRMNTVDKKERMQALNLLKSENKINITFGTNNTILYELVVEEKSPDDIVLEVITESGKNGIWIRDIRFKTKLSQIMLNKALKSLENKKLIRSIKAISNRKLYVLFGLEPDESITGGALFDSGSMREDVVKNLKSTCFQYLYDRFEEAYKQMLDVIHSIDNETIDADKMYASASQIFANLQSRSLFADIKLGDVEQILNILSYECKLLKMMAGNRILYRYNPYNRDKTDLFYAPCMVCHLYKDCKPGSVNIGPENCQYLNVDQFTDDKL